MEPDLLDDDMGLYREEKKHVREKECIDYPIATAFSSGRQYPTRLIENYVGTSPLRLKHILPLGLLMSEILEDSFLCTIDIHKWPRQSILTSILPKSVGKSPTKRAETPYFSCFFHRTTL